MQRITRIAIGNTNSYLVRGDRGFVLVDTGFPHQRQALERALSRAGCTPGSLALIVLTHGDIDHSGNAAYLRRRYGAPIALHPGDSQMCLANGVTRERNGPPDDFPKILYLWFLLAMLEYVAHLALRHLRFEPFSPDISLEDGQDLEALGMRAVAYHTPGHSKGSVCLLTPEGELFCGDHLGRVWGRIIHSADDPAFTSTSARLAGLPVRTVYPGHGAPFAAEETGPWGRIER